MDERLERAFGLAGPVDLVNWPEPVVLRAPAMLAEDVHCRLLISRSVANQRLVLLSPEANRSFGLRCGALSVGRPLAVCDTAVHEATSIPPPKSDDGQNH